MTMAYVSYSSPAEGMRITDTVPQEAGAGFVNQAPVREPGFLQNLRIAWKFFFDKPKDTVPSGSIPVFELTTAQLLAAPDNSLYRLGHSTLLLKLQGEFWLTDPVFSERASPFQWMGPKRFHQPPISIADLPPIKGVILSHDHYDHLDYSAILQLAKKTEHFLTPLGVGERLVKWGIDRAKIQQLAWWQSTQVGGMQFVATPAQHFSGRGLHDRDQTLWASWTIIAPDLKIFFSGDTGYFKGFKEIGDKYGPFDLTLMETGAYNKMWPDIHMQPEESLQAHLDLRGKTMLPIHNGTFDLSMHSWYEPFERIVALAQQHGVRISTPQMGEEVDIAEPQTGRRWWLFPNTQASRTVSLQSVLVD
ncbi:MBL fold metallo-hydrolase [Undibacterium sp. Di26W]|uniref:MBL fold metallo-hydrolase n=1 Tax=Undibacterium sp. Di26W TaxID=3413035 RepID=UPI003BF1F75F